MPYTTLVAGTSATASWANANVRDQTIAQFANVAERNSFIGTPVEGMVCVTQDAGLMWVYDGSAWIQYGSFGGWTAWTPALTAVTTSPTSSPAISTSGRYVRWGNTIHGWGRILAGATSTTAGTGDYQFSLPVNVRSAGIVQPVGVLYYLDASGTSRVLSLQTTGAANLTLAVDGTGTISSGSPGLGINDQMRYTFTYEAA
jgi:hypothetical protein